MSLRRYGTWLIGLFTLCALIAVVLQIGELERFVALARSAKPAWLLVAVVLQAATYVAIAACWNRTLAAIARPLPLRSLVPLGLAKLFTDQAVPSIGLSGTVLLARGLARRGIEPGIATQILLVSMVSFYGSFLAAALLALAILWLHHEAKPMLVTAATMFSIVAILIPAAVLGLKQWGKQSPPRWLRRFRGFTDLFESVAHAPMDCLSNRRLLGETFLLYSSIIVLDALTLWVVFRALGEPTGFLTAFVGFMMASVIATIGLVPLGLGTFEASAVAVLSLLGVGVEVALTATLLLRGLTFWLPMLPGLFLVRQELAATTDEKSDHPEAHHVAESDRS